MFPDSRHWLSFGRRCFGPRPFSHVCFCRRTRLPARRWPSLFWPEPILAGPFLPTHAAASPTPLCSMADSKMLPSQVAAEAIRKHGRGIRWVPLDQLSVGSFNRPISPKYVHHRGLQIMTKDGFATSRYKYCIAIEANPTKSPGRGKPY